MSVVILPLRFFGAGIEHCEPSKSISARIFSLETSIFTFCIVRRIQPLKKGMFSIWSPSQFRWSTWHGLPCACASLYFFVSPESRSYNINCTIEIRKKSFSRFVSYFYDVKLWFACKRGTELIRMYTHRKKVKHHFFCEESLQKIPFSVAWPYWNF